MIKTTHFTFVNDENSFQFSITSENPTMCRYVCCHANNPGQPHVMRMISVDRGLCLMNSLHKDGYDWFVVEVDQPLVGVSVGMN